MYQCRLKDLLDGRPLFGGMAQAKAADYVVVKVTEVGFADEDGLEGLVLLKAPSDESFTMRAFSGETAMHMSRFEKGDRSSIPSVYNMIEEFAEKQGLHLAGIEVFPSGNVLRSDLQFVGKGKEMLLRGYRASDAIAIALFYDAPILLHRSLLDR
jgi:bifunctional DNase/RNase